MYHAPARDAAEFCVAQFGKRQGVAVESGAVVKSRGAIFYKTLALGV
jgi:hypothetical protein